MIRLRRIVLLAAFLTACSGGSDKKSCDPVAKTGCDSGLVCEYVQGGEPGCFAPVVISGAVSNLVTTVDSAQANLNDARVVALDTNQAPLSRVAVTSGTDSTGAPLGNYSLSVPAQRDASGKPLQTFFTVRADKQGYETFPSGLRSALPIDLSLAKLDTNSNTWVISPAEASTLNVKLLKLDPTTAASATAFIHGTVARPPSGAGALVVAEPAPGGAGPQTGVTGVADADGSYAIFNLTPGTQYVVTAYTKGANYAPVTTAALADGDNLADLALAGGAGAAVSGTLIYNNGAASPVAVTLVLESTYVPNLDRGESPPGLTVSGGGTYDFAGIPDGRYIALAAFGLDGDVRNISGTGNTAAPQIAVQGGVVGTFSGGTFTPGTPPNFKIVPGVDLRTIDGIPVSGSPAVVTSATPNFVWQSSSVDSSAATYRVQVFNTFGEQIWNYDLAAATGQNSAVYAGIALEPGMTYQLRILALKDTMPVSLDPAVFQQLSQTEDVAGVFVYQP